MRDFQNRAGSLYGRGRSPAAQRKPAPVWTVGRVTRPDAGGHLYNAVRYDEATGRLVEADSTPTHDRATAQAIADRLNRGAP